MTQKPGILTSFFRYNIVAIIATAIDFLVLVLFTEVLQFWYLFSAIQGSLAGGITGFVLGRNWTFMKQDGKLSTQAIKYVLVWITSIFLNIMGLYLVVEYLETSYIISKTIVAIVIGVGFNFFMHKNFIFK